MPDLIHTKGLKKIYREIPAVDGVDLSIPPGELFGIVGPDGAGKTTLLRLLAGLLDISEGSASINGRDLARQPEEIKPLIGYMAQEFSLYAKLSVLENLRFFAELYDVPRETRRDRTGELLAFAGLTGFKDRRAAHLSGGMQKKLALACTLIHHPPLLLLDEPTTGVDPVSRREFWHILTDLHLAGTTILVSTPYMDEADRCSRVGLMYGGQMVMCDTPQNIRGRLGGEVVEIIPDDWQTARRLIQDLAGIHEIQTYGKSLHIVVDSGPKRLRQIKRRLKQAHISIEGARVTRPRMEEAFISLIRGLEEEG
jgi:ABC-2 type transport system ATP-binding protein